MVIQKVIVVEDDPQVRGLLDTFLTRLGFDVQAFETAESFLLSDLRLDHAAYVVDNNLPGIQGSDLLSAIRSRDVVSPIFMVAGDHDEKSKRDSLLKGADDYLYKPFDIELLAIRMKTAISRANFCLSSRIESGIKFIPRANTIMVNGKAAALSGREYKILSYLLAHPQQVITRQELVANFDDAEITMRTIDVHISSLRKKLEGIDLSIETCRGKGYMASTEALAAPHVISG